MKEKALDILDSLTLKDIKANPISKSEIRNAVETYYDIQDIRIISGNRKFAVNKSAASTCDDNNDTNNSPETSLYLQYVEARFKETEETIAKFLKCYAENDPVGRWLLSIPGCGPVLSSALLAYIDISKCATAGSIWSYAGWTGPMADCERKKGEKINYNPRFRVVCWKLGQSFIKVSGRDNDIYGKLYLEKKQYYLEKNEAGGFKEKAAFELQHKKYDKETASYAAYSQGMLPNSQIVAMSARFAVKIFLSHLFTLWYEYDRGIPAPKPFVESQLGHVHIMSPPHREILFPD